MTATLELVELKCPTCGHSSVEKHANQSSVIIDRKLVTIPNTTYKCPVCKQTFMSLGISKN